jgi:hydroxymethylbilane synthase
VKLGTRGSALALAQARLVAGALDGEVEVVPIKTSGAATDKARFVKELEQALLAGEVDLAVHSAKDVPSELPEGLAIVGVPPREDPRDALCGASALEQLPDGALVGTGSLRRRSQLLAARPDLEVRDLRGNVDTRLRRLEEGHFDALVLAVAGLSRLGRAEGSPVPTAVLCPAPGQGCLVLEAREGDDGAAAPAAAITDREALLRLTAERALVAALGASCRTPIGGHAELDGETLRLSAYAGLPDGSTWVRDELAGSAGEPAALGEAVARRMLAAGAEELLDRAEEEAVRG